jgi:exonuclease III
MILNCKFCRCGDLNVSHQSIDIANPKSNTKTAGFTQEERDDFAKILADGFIDSCMLIFTLNIIIYLKEIV